MLDYKIVISQTRIYGKSKKEVDDLWRILIAKLDPWLMGFITDGPPFIMRKYSGSDIHYQGVKFSGSPRDVFWGGFIEPFLEHGIVDSLDATVRTCREASLENSADVINEKVRLLKKVAENTYRHMADIDHRLLTSNHQLMANPPHVARRDISANTQKIHSFIDSQGISAIALIPHVQSPFNIIEKIRWVRKNWKRHWKLLSIAVLIILIGLTWPFILNLLRDK